MQPAGRRLAEHLEAIVDELDRLAAYPAPPARDKLAWLLAAHGYAYAAAVHLAPASPAA